MRLFLITIVTVFFIAKAPDGSFARFQRDLGNLVARRPMECTAMPDHSRTGPLASKLADFASAMSEGAHATRDLYRTVASGDQPELRYEKHLDDIFEETLHPHY